MVNAAPATNVAVAIAWRIVEVDTGRTLRQPRDLGHAATGGSERRRHRTTNTSLPRKWRPSLTRCASTTSDNR